jgi:hypothetical protein
VPDLRISELPTATLTDDDLLVVVDGVDTTTKKVTAADVKAYAADGGGGTTVEVVTSTAGVWPSRPTADLVFWVAGSDTAATSPAGATGDDVVILAQDADLTAIAALASAANRVPYATGVGTWALADFTAAGRALVDDADAAAQRLTLGLVIGTDVAAQASLASYLPLTAAGASVTDVGAIDERVNVVASSGATRTLNVSTHGVHDVTMNVACEFTFGSPAPSGRASSFMLILRGAFTPTFPASVRWASATAPTYATPSVFVFSTVDAGTTWFGSMVGSGFG